MIGARFTEGDAQYEVTAADGGAWIVVRVDQHEPPRRMTTAEIAATFETDADVADPEQPSESDGWEALAAANDRAALRLALIENPYNLEPDEGTEEHEAWQRAVKAARPKAEPSPEQHFQRIADEDARRIQPKARGRR